MQLAFGAPGIEPRWTHGTKDAVGTAYSTSSQLWFTISRGVPNEIYYPTIDLPQVRDLGFLIAGKEFWHEEKRHIHSEIEPIAPGTLGFRLRSEDPEGRYRLYKEIIADPHAPCLLLYVRLEADDPAFLETLRLYVLLAPHLDGDGWGDSGYTATVAGREILTAKGDRTWLALGASQPFLKRSCGYVGHSDAWQDLSRHGEMKWEFGKAVDGNIALAGEIDLRSSKECMVALAFGDSLHRASSTLFQSLGLPFEEHRARFVRQWQRAGAQGSALEGVTCDGGDLLRATRTLLLAHEDKSYPGAMIASLSIPWGESRGDEDLGGYHLVWTRDLCQSASALLALGDRRTPLRSLIYLACTQRPDGGFYQNFWIDGRPHSYEIALDEVAHAILFAWQLREAGALAEFDPTPMVRAAAGYLVKNAPYAKKERWGELAGISPGSLAVCIAALVAAAEFLKDAATRDLLLGWADFLERHIERWTVTSEGRLHPEISRHYVRVSPAKNFDDESRAISRGLVLAEGWADGQREISASQMVDAGFLALVRYGLRSATDPLVEASLRVVDRVLRVETPKGSVWRRYNGDSYGQCDDGGPWRTRGRGRAWPLLVGERGHYELCAGRDAREQISTMEKMASRSGLLPQQVWDAADLPEKHLFLGGVTGAATPFLWAHAEYAKLVRSLADGKIFDEIPGVRARYATRGRSVEIWTTRRQCREVPRGGVLVVQGEQPFVVQISGRELRGQESGLGVYWVEIAAEVQGEMFGEIVWSSGDRQGLVVRVSEDRGE